MFTIFSVLLPDAFNKVSYETPVFIAFGSIVDGTLTQKDRDGITYNLTKNWRRGLVERSYQCLPDNIRYS